MVYTLTEDKDMVVHGGHETSRGHMHSHRPPFDSRLLMELHIDRR